MRAWAHGFGATCIVRVRHGFALRRTAAAESKLTFTFPCRECRGRVTPLDVQRTGKTVIVCSFRL